MLAAIAALIGSGGVAGAVSVAFQHSTTARLRRAVLETAEIPVDPDTGAGAALRAARDRAAYELAARELVPGYPWSLRVYLVAALLMSGVLAYISFADVWQQVWSAAAVDPSIVVVGILFGVVTAMLVGSVISFGTGLRRRAVVNALIRGAPFGVTVAGTIYPGNVPASGRELRAAARARGGLAPGQGVLPVPGASELALSDRDRRVRRGSRRAARGSGRRGRRGAD